MEMLHGFLHGAAVFSAIGKCPGDADGTHRVKPVRVLYDLSLQGVRNLSPVPAEGNSIDARTDPVDPLCRHPAFQNSPRVSVILRMEQFVIIRIMQEGRKRYDLSVAPGSVSAIRMAL